MKTQIKALLFDMDGVLVDANDWHFQALNKALTPYGFELGEQEHLQTYNGLPTRGKLEILSSQKGLPREFHDAIHQAKQINTLEMIDRHCRPIPTHLQALRQLKGDGLRLAVCSNAIRSTVQIMMERLELIEFLEFFLSNEDVVHAKPHPEMYESAMEKLALKPQECLIIEDSEHGLAAAYASGAHVLKVSSTTEVNYQTLRDALLRLS